MKPGRELDALIAEKVFGLNLEDKFTGETMPITAIQALHSERSLERIPHFSTDIAAAWLVVDKLSQKYWMTLDYPPYYGWLCNFRAGDGTGNDFQAEAATAPHAICLAALKAIS